MTTVLEMNGLIKRFGDKTVVDGISLQIKRGECFGILGPNGAGKSTLMRMLYGLTEITEGEAYILGLNLKKSIKSVKAKIGVVPQDDGLDSEFTVMENLLLFSRLHGIESKIARYRAEELLHLMRLEDVKNNFVDTLSGGMKRRLVIARAMLNHPEIIFLDEPTSGLDPQARVWIWEFLRKIKAELGTIVLTTHYMEEAEKICDRIAIIDHGTVLAVGKPAELIKKEIGEEVIEFRTSLPDLPYYLARLKEKGLNYQVMGNTVSIHFQTKDNALQYLPLISKQEVRIRQPHLDDVFFKLAGHELREDLV